MPKGDMWRILAIFFMTMGVIAVMGALLAKTSIHETGVPYLTEYSSPIFAFAGAVISVFLLHKEGGSEKWDFRDVVAVFIVGIVIIILYTTVPEYLPESFSVLKWNRMPLLP